MYFPLSGVEPEIDKKVLLYSERSLFNREYILKKDSSFLFPFPIYNRELLISKDKPIKKRPVSCINCNRCNSYCPEGVYPQYFYHYLDNDFIEEVEKLDVKDCTLCGVCSFICPSNLPIKTRIHNFFVSEEKDSGTI